MYPLYPPPRYRFMGTMGTLVGTPGTLNGYSGYKNTHAYRFVGYTWVHCCRGGLDHFIYAWLGLALVLLCCTRNKATALRSDRKLR